MATITVRKEDVSDLAKVAYPDYRGHKHRVRVAPTKTITASDVTWCEGSRSQYCALRYVVGVWQVVYMIADSPWSGQTWSGVIPDDVVIVEWCIFCGKDLGLTYYISPNSMFLTNLRKQLPAPVELTPPEKVVLEALCGLKPFARTEEYRRAGLGPQAVLAAVAGLVSRSLPTEIRKK